MAEPIVWAELPKSQSDSTVIDAEIDAKIATHNSDPDAHMEELASLAEHRESEIIDHLAESIVADKLALNIRTYTAVVDRNSPADFDNIQDAADYVNAKGGGVIKLRPGVYTLSQNLVISPLVSIEGEGTQVSQIVSDSTTRRYIQYAAYFSTNNFINDVLNFLTNDDTFYKDGGDWNSPPVLGMCAYLEYAPGPPFSGMVIDAGGDYVVLDTTSPSDSEDTPNITFFAGAYPTEGSDQITLEGEQTCSYLGIYIGMQIVNVTTNFVAYVENIIDDTIIVLSQPYTGDEYFAPWDYHFTGEHQPYIQGVTLGAPNAPITLYNWLEDFKMECIRCEFLSGNDSVYWLPYGFIGYVERPWPLLRLYDCLIKCDATDYAVQASFARFESCQFIPTEPASKGAAVTYESWIDDTFFGDSSWLGTNPACSWLWSYGNPLFVTNCTFYDGDKTGIAAGGSPGGVYGLALTGCHIINTANQAVSLAGLYARIIGCRFEFAGTSSLTLASGFEKSVFATNVMNLTPTNSSTNSAVGNNVSY